MHSGEGIAFPIRSSRKRSAVTSGNLSGVESRKLILMSGLSVATHSFCQSQLPSIFRSVNLAGGPRGSVVVIRTFPAPQR